MDRSLHRVVLAVAGALLAGCAVLPTGPAVPALPGSRAGGSFAADDADCRRRAGGAMPTDTVGHSSHALQAGYDRLYFECMYARGHRVPAAAVTQRAPDGRYPVPHGAAEAPRDAPPPRSFPPPSTQPPATGFPPAGTPPPPSARG